MKIVIKTIEHKEQRYDTAGDWTWEDDGTLLIKVSHCAEEASEFLVGIHEAIEAYLFSRDFEVRRDAQLMVDDFDESFKSEVHDEPGDSPNAPYHKEHRIATIIERLLADTMNFDWTRHEENLDRLGEK